VVERGVPAVVRYWLASNSSRKSWVSCRFGSFISGRFLDAWLSSGSRECVSIDDVGCRKQLAMGELSVLYLDSVFTKGDT
jgi:hypothetical protein